MQQMIFIADLIACSTCFGHHYTHHQELESIIQVVAAYRIWCLVFQLSVWCGAEGCVSGLRAAGAPKHVEQAIRSAIKIICCIQLAFYFHIFINFQTLSRNLNLKAADFLSLSVLMYETVRCHVPNI